MLCRARQKYPDLEFVQADAHDLSSIEGPFDSILLSDLVNDVWDVQRVLEHVRRLCLPSTRIILNFYSGLWQAVLTAAQKLDLAASMLPQNWLTPVDARGMLYLAGFDVIRSWHEVLWPLPLGGLANRVLVRIWPFNELALSNFIIARPQPEPPAEEPSVSIIVPARNESGNIPAIFERTPSIGGEMEFVFVEGHSRDDTYAAIEREIAGHPGTPARLLRQAGIGKADAVRRTS